MGMHLDNDDALIGRILSRREILTVFGAAAGALLLAACAPGPAATQAPTNVPAPASSQQPTVPPAATAATQASPSATARAAATALQTPPPASVVIPTCIVKPALTEGPYFVDEKLNRSDIRSDPSDNSVRPGTPLNITFRVAKISGSSCVALAGATIDVWHCDALGVYSDSSDPNFGSTRGKKFLRGYQTTDANGMASFTTIYPGWY